jgi:hypothetical protein
MGAYTLDIKLSCDESGCEKREVVCVYNTLNSCQGQFCRRHGMKRRDELNKSEAAMIRGIVADREEHS